MPAVSGGMGRRKRGRAKGEGAAAALPAPMILPDVLDLPAAQPLRDRLAQSIGGGAVEVDAATVERMSTPCAQVLLAAARAADAASTTFKIVNCSDAFRMALADLGLAAEFAKWMN